MSEELDISCIQIGTPQGACPIRNATEWYPLTVYGMLVGELRFGPNGPAIYAADWKPD